MFVIFGYGYFKIIYKIQIISFVPYYAIMLINSYILQQTTKKSRTTGNAGVKRRKTSIARCLRLIADYITELVILKRNIKEIMIVGLSTALMGQVYFYPFGTDFRITIGVVVFTFLILYFQAIPVIAASVTTGFCVLLIRVLIDVFVGPLSLDAAAARHIPALVYYVTYGIVIEGIGFRRHAEKPIYFIVILSAADIFSNFFELIIRNQLNTRHFDSIFSTIILIAVFRSILVFLLFWIIKYYNLLITKEDHQKRYKDLLLLTAKLKSEIFFLRKSMQDIENAMAKSYSIYNMVKDSENMHKEALEQVASDCLTLSIDIHEIKKDYNRVVMSMEKLLPTGEKYEPMRLSEIFETINDVFGRYLDVINKTINLSFELERDFKTDAYFIIISILNNLIQNSIEASTDADSFIKVKCVMTDGNIVFSVADNGKGIKDKDRELIFEPGYTTKFNPETGKMSTGLGLVHIAMLTKHLKGKIQLNNSYEITEFIIEFPAEALMIKEGFDD